MTGELLGNRLATALDADAAVINAASLEFFLSTTTTPADVYHEAALTTPWVQPIHALSDGRWPDVYLDPTVTYKMKMTLADGQIRTIDPVNRVVGTGDLTFLQLGTGATSRTLLAKMQETISVKDYGATGDGTTDDTAALVAAYNHCVAAGKTLYFPAGTYRAWLVITASNVSIRGDGSATTTIKLPDAATHTITVEAGPGTASGVPCVLDFGQIGAGNSATVRSGAHISGLTLDGNKANTTGPATDLFGWGMAFTKYSDVTYDDIVVNNCHAGGIGTFINSNHHNGTNWVVTGCGFNIGHPGFDVNSSKYSRWAGIIVSCRDGARLLDNCWLDRLDVVVYNATNSGFIYTNQLDATPGAGNYSIDNLVNAQIYDGCTSGGVQIGYKCYNSQLNIICETVTGQGINELKPTDQLDVSKGNVITLTTRKGDVGACTIGGNNSTWIINSQEDAQTGAVGDFYAVAVTGKNNNLNLLIDNGTRTATIRGISFASGADSNYVSALQLTNTVSPISDSGANNRYLLSGSKTFNPPSVANNAITSTDVTVAGALVGMNAQAAFSNSLQALQLTAYVSSTSTVTCIFANTNTGGAVDLASGTLTAVVQAA